MIKKIDHIGIAVAELEPAVAFYRDILRLEFEGYQTLPDRGLRVGIFKVGNVHIELLESISPDSAIAKYIERNGEGMHHIAFESDDVQSALDQLGDSGVRLIDKTPQPGAAGSQVAFLHPKSTNRVLMELCQKP